MKLNFVSIKSKICCFLPERHIFYRRRNFIFSRTFEKQQCQQEIHSLNNLIQYSKATNSIVHDVAVDKAVPSIVVLVAVDAVVVDDVKPAQDGDLARSPPWLLPLIRFVDHLVDNIHLKSSEEVKVINIKC